MSMLKHAIVKLKSGENNGYRRPFGNAYKAKGAYRNGNKCIVVGCLEPGSISTMRMSYHVDEVESIEFVYEEKD